MTVTQAFDDVAAMLAVLDPAKIVLIKASEAMSERVEMLVQQKKEGTINQEELLELERYLALDLLINLAKARARGILAA